MFLIDTLFLMPVRGVMAVFQEIQKAAQQDVANEAEAIRTQLAESYMLLETGRMTEEEFEDREKELLDRLDVIEARDSDEAEEEEEASAADEEPEEEDGEKGDAAEAASQAIVSQAPKER